MRSELAVTDWKPGIQEHAGTGKKYIDPDIVMADDISGFADLSFWGKNNIIEPDKSIQNAKNKIREKL